MLNIFNRRRIYFLPQQKWFLMITVQGNLMMGAVEFSLSPVSASFSSHGAFWDFHISFFRLPLGSADLRSINEGDNEG